MCGVEFERCGTGSGLRLSGEPSGGFAPSVHGSNGTSGIRNEKENWCCEITLTLCDASEAIAISEAWRA